MRVFYSDAVPKEVLYLMPEPRSVEVGPILFQRDPWPKPTYALRPEYAMEREKGLDHLADLLDRMCEDLGMSPEAAWRDPKWDEQTRMDQVRFQTHLRLALDIHRPDDYTRIAKGVLP